MYDNFKSINQTYTLEEVQKELVQRNFLSPNGGYVHVGDKRVGVGPAGFLEIIPLEGLDKSDLEEAIKNSSEHNTIKIYGMTNNWLQTCIDTGIFVEVEGRIEYTDHARNAKYSIEEFSPSVSRLRDPNKNIFDGDHLGIGFFDK